MKKRSKIALSVCLLLAQAIPALAVTKRAFADIKLTPTVSVSEMSPGQLRPDAAEVADVLEITPYVQQLMAAKASGTAGSAGNIPRNLLKTKLVCLYRIVMAQEEVRRIAAIIDRDLAAANIDMSTIGGKQARFNNAMTTANFMQGGTLGIVKQSLGLHGQFAASQYELMVSFGLGTTLSVINLAVPMFWQHEVDLPPNSLAYFLHLKQSPSDADSSYLWKFFNKEVPQTNWKMSRREVLLNHWRDFAGLDVDDEHNHRILAAFPAPPAVGAEDKKLRERFGHSVKRILLLHDLKTHLEEFDASLYELHKAIEGN